MRKEGGHEYEQNENPSKDRQLRKPKKGQMNGQAWCRFNTLMKHLHNYNDVVWVTLTEKLA